MAGQPAWNFGSNGQQAVPQSSGQTAGSWQNTQSQPVMGTNAQPVQPVQAAQPVQPQSWQNTQSSVRGTTSGQQFSGANPMSGTGQAPILPGNNGISQGSFSQGAGTNGVSGANGVNQGIPIDNVGELAANGGFTGTAPMNNTPNDPSVPTMSSPSASPSATRTNASFKNLPSILGIFSVLIFSI